MFASLNDVTRYELASVLIFSRRATDPHALGSMRLGTSRLEDLAKRFEKESLTHPKHAAGTVGSLGRLSAALVGVAAVVEEAAPSDGLLLNEGGSSEPPRGAAVGVWRSSELAEVLTGGPLEDIVAGSRGLEGERPNRPQVRYQNSGGGCQSD